MSEAETFRCARHPDTETTLRCSKCGIPICPRCLIETPVGARCRECARIKKTPTYALSTRYLLRAIGAGIGGAIITGVIWGFINLILPSYFFTILLAAGAGYLIGEIITRAVNRKRGTVLAIIGGLSVVLTFGVVNIVELIALSYLGFSAGRIGFSLFSVGVGIFMAVNRLR